VQLNFRHLSSLCEMGKQLERQCEFAIALKCYYAGRAFYRKNSHSEHSDPKFKMPLYEALHDALSKVAETSPEWKLQHAGVLLPEVLGGVAISKEIRVQHVQTLISSCCQNKTQQLNEEVSHFFVIISFISGYTFIQQPLKTPSDLLRDIEDIWNRSLYCRC
jgi:hypothetical protein